MRQYLDAVREVLETGTRKENRTGVDTLSTFNINYEIDLRHGFPLLTTKQVSWKNIVIENLWFISGDTSIDFLRKHNCKFWDAWADADGLVPSAYGNFWRHFPVHGRKAWTDDEYNAFNDQLAWAVEELKKNPMSRRVVISAWAPGNAQQSKLPPCHALFVLNVQNRSIFGNIYPKVVAQAAADRVPPPPDVMERQLCLHLTQRSCDIALGVPYNIAGYAFILELISRFTGLRAGLFAHTLIDAHAYTSKPDGSMAKFDHVPNLRTQLERTPKLLPQLVIDDRIQALSDVEALIKDNASTDEILGLFRLDGYDPHPALDFKVAV